MKQTTVAGWGGVTWQHETDEVAARPSAYPSDEIAAPTGATDLLGAYVHRQYGRDAKGKRERGPSQEVTLWWAVIGTT